MINATNEHADLITKIILHTATPDDFYRLFPKKDSFPGLNEFLKTPVLSAFGIDRDYKHINVLDGSFNLGKSYAILRRTRKNKESVQEGYIIEELNK